MDGEWTDARRRRWKQLSMGGDRPRWNHSGVTSMFVSNLPPEVNMETLKNVFSKHGEVVDVYMALKKDVNRKTFSFVRFKRVDDEIELERALQGIKIGTRMQDVSIARDNKSFAEVVAGSSKPSGIPTLPPKMKFVPIKLSDASPLCGWVKWLKIGVKFMNDESIDAFLKGWTEWFSRVDSGDIATINADRITWIKVSGLPLELWSEENFMTIAESVGKVIAP
ncbi:unnamed protein product [Lactuca saligna]|uniref:RRM domain-containing protein n=1 Tax=Lactuca saligna TaxID=75948 RepID=A0AA35YFU3_LACSI|nr:unnamed protein product [Lactuca saligna]